MGNLIRWVEIPTTDFERAVNFYNKVFRLDLQSSDYGLEKMACFPNDEGAIVFSPGHHPSSNGPIISFNSQDSIDQTLNVAIENGAEILVDKTKIQAEGRGYFALFLDSEKNKIGLYSDN